MTALDMATAMRETHHLEGTAGFADARAAASAGGEAVCRLRAPGRGGAAPGSQAQQRELLASGLASPVGGRAEAQGFPWPAVSALGRATAAAGAGPAGRAGGGRLRHRTVDCAPGAQADPGALSGALSRNPCLVPAAQVGLDLPEASQAGHGARRGSRPDLGEAALAAAQKGALRTGATLVFWDEAGFSQRPRVGCTWTPRGKTPILKQPFNWKRPSAIGVITHRPITGQVRQLFSVGPGNVDSNWVTGRLRSLRQLAAGPVILLWHGLSARIGGLTRRCLEGPRHWLQAEPLPAYAPELNPVGAMGANLSARELANLCLETLGELALHVQRGMRRLHWHPDLGYAFLKHSGLFPELFL